MGRALPQGGTFGRDIIEGAEVLISPARDDPAGTHRDASAERKRLAIHTAASATMGGMPCGRFGAE